MGRRLVADTTAGWWNQTGRMVGPDRPDRQTRTAGWWDQTGRIIGPERPDGGESGQCPATPCRSGRALSCGVLGGRDSEAAGEEESGLLGRTLGPAGQTL